MPHQGYINLVCAELHKGDLAMRYPSNPSQAQPIWKELAQCPEWPLITCISSGGGWTNAALELFAASEQESPTHAHFYTSKEHAREIYPDLKRLIPPTITTVSFK